MDPITILSFISLAMKAAPTVEKIAIQGKEMIDRMIANGEVTVEQQNKVNDWADAHMKATLAGEIAPELVID